MKCLNCNLEVKDGMKFCPKCGAEIPQIHFCSQCGTEIKDGMRFCPKCGLSLESSSHVRTTSIDSKPSMDEITSPHNAPINTSSSGGYSKAKKWLGIAAVIIFVCYLGGTYFTSGDNNSSTNYNSSTYTNTYGAELEEAERELQRASDELNEILPYYQSVIAQYGGGQMAVIAATQNNPQLFRNFDSAESYYERCFEKVASIYDKMGYPESAEAYRKTLRDWRGKVQRMKGMY